MLILDPDTLTPLDTHDLQVGQRVVIEAPSPDGHGTTFTEGNIGNVEGNRVTVIATIYPAPEDNLDYCYTPAPSD